MGNRKKEQEAFEQMFKSKKQTPFSIPGAKASAPGAKAAGAQAKGTQIRSTRQSNRGV